MTTITPPITPTANPFYERIAERLARRGGKYRPAVGVRCNPDTYVDFECYRLALICHRERGLPEPVMR